MLRQLPMYQRQGKAAFKKDLSNTLALSETLGNPHKAFKSVHIAGTNGKGTTAHIIAAGLQSNGLTVGMYTSPHYVDFRERIKINGELIPEDNVVAFIQKYKAVIEEIQPSFFEITVGMAFYYFAEQNVDVAIIETGLGGRLDSTNIITPLVSVITNISLDHQSMLGNTVQQIAPEKAGIIKENIPVIIGEYQVETESIFKTVADERNATMVFAEDVSEAIFDGQQYVFNLSGLELVVENLPRSLQSSYQLKNLRTALVTLHTLKEQFAIDFDSVASGIQDISSLTYYIGRWQQLQTEPLVIADSAHNVAGVSELLRNIYQINYRQLHIVIGMVNDKDISSVLTLLPNQATYYFCKADIPRGMDSSLLQEKAATFGLDGDGYMSVEHAFSHALDVADSEDFILVMGSVFVVAEVLTSHHL